MNATDAHGGHSLRVVLAEMPAMMAAIISDALQEGGVGVANRLSEDRDPSEAVEEWQADVVIVPSTSSGVSRRYHELLRRHPRLKVLTITAVAEHADLYELRLLGSNVGRQGVVAAVRAVMDETLPYQTRQKRDNCHRSME